MPLNDTHAVQNEHAWFAANALFWDTYRTVLVPAGVRGMRAATYILLLKPVVHQEKSAAQQSHFSLENHHP